MTKFENTCLPIKTGTEYSETSAYKFQTPENYPEENIQHREHGKSLKSRIFYCKWRRETLKWTWLNINTKYLQHEGKNVPNSPSNNNQLFWRKEKFKKKKYIYIYTGCPRRNVPDFGRAFLMLKYTDITQNTYVQSWTVTEIMAREVWNFDSCYTLADYQIHIKTGRNMWFL